MSELTDVVGITHDGPHGYISNKDDYLKRLRRIEGQARGLQGCAEPAPGERRLAQPLAPRCDVVAAHRGGEAGVFCSDHSIQQRGGVNLLVRGVKTDDRHALHDDSRSWQSPDP